MGRGMQQDLTRQQMQQQLLLPVKLNILAVVGTGLLMVTSKRRADRSLLAQANLVSSLQGVLLCQTRQYYRQFRTDRAVWRWMVPILTLLGVSYFAVTIAVRLCPLVCSEDWS